MFEHDWKNIGALVSLVVLAAGYFFKIHLRIMRWWRWRPGVRIAALEKRIMMLETTIESKDNISIALELLRTSLEQGHDVIMGKIDGVSNDMAWVKSDVAQIRGGHITFKTNHHGGIIDCNYRMMHTLGKSFADLSDMNFVNLLEQSERGPFMKRYREAIADRRNIEENVRMNGANFTIKAYPVHNNGKGLLGYSGTIEPKNKK